MITTSHGRSVVDCGVRNPSELFPVQESEMTRFKCMSVMLLLLALAGRGVTTFSQAPAPVCTSMAGPHLYLCDGISAPNFPCENCASRFHNDGWEWSNCVTKNTVTGTNQVGSYVTTCQTTYPCVKVIIPFALCDNWYFGLGGCPWGASSCPSYSRGVPVVSTVTTFYTVPCPPPPTPPPPAPHGA